MTLPAGPFRMGVQAEAPDKPNYDPGAYDSEVVREVKLWAFQIGRYPVTVKEYRRFVEDDGSRDSTW